MSKTATERNAHIRQALSYRKNRPIGKTCPSCSNPYVRRTAVFCAYCGTRQSKES